MNIKLILFIFVSLLFSSTMLQSCASTKKNKTLNSFDQTTRLYGRMLRWQEYEGAVNLIRHQDESDVEVNLDGYKDLRITGYEIKKVVMGDDLKTAVVTAEIAYYFEPTNAVKTIRDSQNWWYSEDAEKWFLDDEFPAF